MSASVSASTTPVPDVRDSTPVADSPSSPGKSKESKKAAVSKKGSNTKKASTKVKTATAAGPGRPSWKEIIKACIVDHKEEARQGVSRSTIKKYAEEKHNIDVSGNNLFQLKRAIATGAEDGIFVQPKGPAGKVKLAPRVKASVGSKENSKPPSRSTAGKTTAKKVNSVSKTDAVKPGPKPTISKKTAAPKKALAGKPKAAAVTKKNTAPAKRGAAKKAVMGMTPAAKAKAAAKKEPTKKGTAGKAATKKASTTISKPRSRPGRGRPASRARK
ncbi:hypothetical protein AGABI1DRAFT_125427 [Agaricus bisporus var. burnettii JB137-S8]|uniref:Histone H1 n=1 Tax=Agaricus bisporus var. burnettii (strain JB137-S8 / ATCC MYA-4627 / FGSC 10392) TaxID=597362 RepID=K5Y4I6_AGABU|nr:uncharacterized protein AGABI1DRAFT_125427 [Agaricus bisporus var. burnettii JB137-S8]EKM82950.1 hypothetical protein AGABI1DRAFT_125427 [Agaricus bisporus var. burnettii JB137-S8]